MIKWPKELVSDISRRRCVIVLGSGISKGSVNDENRSPKTWKEFLLFMSKNIPRSKHINKLIADGDYLTACEVIKRTLGREEFINYLRDEFLVPGYRKSKTHELIFKLDSRVVATPNFDKIYETYANAESHGTIVVKNHYDPDTASTIRNLDRVILKMHGTIDAPERMIFTRKEYSESRILYANFYKLIEALSLTHTFIFLGCGVNDPDIKLILEDTFSTYKSNRSHVMLMPKGVIHSDVITIIQDTMNLRLMEYSDKNNHQELYDSLLELVSLVEKKRDELSENMNW